MPCPSCGFPDDDDDHQCRQCGRLLPAIAIAAPAAFVVRKPEVEYVAPPMRRVTAAVIDASVVLLGFGTFVCTASLFGSKLTYLALAVCLAFLSAFYGLIRVVAMRDTAGMNCVQLRLATFDGSRVSRRHRAIRLVWAWLGYTSGGLSLLWALADSESLAFHDLASNTYPAEK